MNIIETLSKEGFQYYPLNIPHNGINFKLHISNDGIVFLIKTEDDIGYVKLLINSLEVKFNYLVIWEKEEQLFLSKNTLDTFIKSSEESLLQKIQQTKNKDYQMNAFLDRLKMNWGKEKEFYLSNGTRWVERSRKKQEAFSVEESNEFYKSQLFKGPFGIHYLEYAVGFSQYWKFLLYLFTSGLYGVTWLDSLILMLGGKKHSLNFRENEKEMWVIPDKSKKNWLLLLKGLPYTLLIIVVMNYIYIKGFSFIAKTVLKIAGGI